MRHAMMLAFAMLAAGSAWSATLDGRIVEDHSGNPLASVEVRVYKIGQRTLAAHLETDTAGRFRADGLPAGEYRIEATKANFIGATVHTQGVAAGLIIRLVRCGVITGQVVDAQGQPLLGTTVYVMPKPPSGPLRPLPPSAAHAMTRVDGQGSYRLHGLPPGDYAIAAAYGASTAMFGSTGGAEVKPGIGSGVQFYPNNQRPQFFAVTGGEQYRNIDFSITPTTLHSVSGKVELPDPKARFWLALISPDQPGLAIAVAQTNPDGAFKFEGIASGSYVLTASGPTRGYGGKAVLSPGPYFGRTQVSVALDVENLVVAVQQGKSLAFVLRPDGAGCPTTAQITLVAMDDFAAQIDRSGEIAVDKEQTLADLAPTRYQVTLGRLGDSCYQASIPVLDLAAGVKESPVAVHAAAAGSVRGKLSGAPNPADFAIALIAADPETSAQPVQVVFPTADGRFTFAGLRPGRYRIATQPKNEVSKARWVTDAARMIEIQIAAGAPTEMELPAPQRSGQ